MLARDASPPDLRFVQQVRNEVLQALECLNDVDVSDSKRKSLQAARYMRRAWLLLTGSRDQMIVG